MLSKQIHIARILLAVLLFSQAGFAVNVMYCHDNVNKVTVNFLTSSEEKDSCGHDEVRELPKKGCYENSLSTDADKKCCFVEVISQNGTDYLNVFGLNFDFFIWNDVYFVFHQFVEFDFKPKNIRAKVGFSSNAPPLYKLYHQYIYYA